MEEAPQQREQSMQRPWGGCAGRGHGRQRLQQGQSWQGVWSERDGSLRTVSGKGAPGPCACSASCTLDKWTYRAQGSLLAQLQNPGKVRALGAEPIGGGKEGLPESCLL